MTKIDDQDYLRTEQYKTSANLQARIALHERFNTNPADWQTWVFDQFAIDRPVRLLEVGCGPASLWKKNRDRLPSGSRAILADLSTGMVAAARSRLEGEPGFHFLCLDAQSIPFPAASFDIVVANHMLYHVPDMDRAVTEFARVLAPGGALFTATNGLRHMAELYDLLHDFNPDFTVDTREVRRYALEQAPEILGRSFNQVEVRVFPADLEVTDPEPLIAYVDSMWDVFADNDPLGRHQLADFIRARFAEQGRILIHKSQGLVIARTST